MEPAINLLQKQVNKNPTAKLHQMLGDLYARSSEEEKAFHHYHIALRYKKTVVLTNILLNEYNNFHKFLIIDWNRTITKQTMDLID